MTRTRSRAWTGRVWAYIGVLLGALVSISANIAHSFVPPTSSALVDGDPEQWSPPLGAVLGATFWPIALFVAVEILARTPWGPGARWVALRWAGLLPVAFVAAFVSYRHLSGLLAFYGEDHVTATLGPLAVDGLMVMATGALLATTPVATGTRPGVVATDGEATSSAASALSLASGQESRQQTASTSAPSTGRGRGRAKDTAAAVQRVHSAHPSWTPAQIATRIGVTERTVRRYLPTATSPASLDALAAGHEEPMAAQEADPQDEAA